MASMVIGYFVGLLGLIFVLQPGPVADISGAAMLAIGTYLVYRSTQQRSA